MPSERQRILELALESLANKKKQIDDEIAALTSELRRGRAPRGVLSAVALVARKAVRRRKRSRFSKEERERRSARMKAYWDEWRKNKARRK